MNKLTDDQLAVLLEKVDPQPFTSDTHVYQVRNLLSQMVKNRFGQEFLFYNLKEIFNGGFPVHYTTDFRLICNQLLRANRREVIPDDDEFLSKIT